MRLKDIIVRKVMRKPLTIKKEMTVLDTIKVLLEDCVDVAVINDEGESKVVTSYSVAEIILKDFKNISKSLEKTVMFISKKVSYVPESKKLRKLMKNLEHLVHSGNLIFLGRGGKITGYLKPEDLFAAYNKNFMCNDINTNFFYPVNCLMIYPNRSIKSTLSSLIKNNSSFAFVYSRSGFKGVIGIRNILSEFVAEENIKKILSGDLGYFYEASISEIEYSKDTCISVEEISREKIISTILKNGNIVILKDKSIYRAIDDKNLLYFTHKVLFMRSL